MARSKLPELGVTNANTRNALVRFTEHGARDGCPFCKGRMIDSLSGGDRIVFLQGRHSGQQATVSNQPGLFEDEFLVKFDWQPENALTRVHYVRDAFMHGPLTVPPEWMCELSIDDLCAIEGAALRLALKISDDRRLVWNANTLLELIAIVWRRRLPVFGSEIWATLDAHGIPQNSRESFCRLFDFGIQLLVSIRGRPAIKKKRVKAISTGRYLTPFEEAYYGPSPGVEYANTTSR